MTPATEKQLALAHKLLHERELPPAGQTRTEAVLISRAEDIMGGKDVSMAEASRVIDYLMHQPMLDGSIPNKASDKQVALIARLSVERDYGKDIAPGNNPCVDTVRKVMAGEAITKHEASVTIDYLFGCAIIAKVQENGEQVTPGVYKIDGEVFIVKPNREKTHVYAKKLVELRDAQGNRVTTDGDHVRIEFEYAPGAIHRIRPEHRMSVEEGKALTLLYGKCICCGRKLKVAVSVERGIGPVCIKYFSN